MKFLRFHQGALRTELYHNLTDYLHQRFNNTDANEVRIGKQVILYRNMHQNYLDAMAIVQKFGKPSFLTMTCNPKWPEIVNCIPNEYSQYRPDIVVRVFHSKIKALINSMIKKKILGVVEAIIYTIEFQKRGLPHAHILLTLKECSRIHSIEQIDKIVSAQIPDFNENPILYECVKRHMMRGPCGPLNMNSVCMQNGKCSKKFPKKLLAITEANINGYPEYKRPDNGRTVSVHGTDLNNSYVVSHNPYLLQKFNCHLNVEVCTTVKSIKYIYKYIHKGYDYATVRFVRTDGQIDTHTQIVNYDEIDTYLQGRYVGSTESLWRLFQYEMHYQTHTLVRLDCHLPDMQNVYYTEGEEVAAINNLRKTKLLAFFLLNRHDQYANNLLYTEVPHSYVWNSTSKKWNRRINNSDKVIARLYAVSVKDVEKFHLRLLLLHVRGPTSFEDLRTHNGVLYNTFVEAAYSRRIASNDNEWHDCLNESKDTQTAKQMRQLFGYICGLNVPANALALWNKFRYYLAEDFLLENDEGVSYNLALNEIEEILITHNTSCVELGLPSPISIAPLPLNQIDLAQELQIFDQMYETLNDDQRSIINNILQQIELNNTGHNVFCVTAHAGCGKTYIQTTLIHKLK